MAKTVYRTLTHKGLQQVGEMYKGIVFDRAYEQRQRRARAIHREQQERERAERRREREQERYENE